MRYKLFGSTFRASYDESYLIPNGLWVMLKTKIIRSANVLFLPFERHQAPRSATDASPKIEFALVMPRIYEYSRHQ